MSIQIPRRELQKQPRNHQKQTCAGRKRSKYTVHNKYLRRKSGVWRNNLSFIEVKIWWGREWIDGQVYSKYEFSGRAN